MNDMPNDFCTQCTLIWNDILKVIKYIFHNNIDYMAAAIFVLLLALTFTTFMWRTYSIRNITKFKQPEMEKLIKIVPVHETDNSIVGIFIFVILCLFVLLYVGYSFFQS